MHLNYKMIEIQSQINPCDRHISNQTFPKVSFKIGINKILKFLFKITANRGQVQLKYITILSENQPLN